MTGRRVETASEVRKLKPEFRRFLENMSSMDQNYFIDPDTNLNLPHRIRVFAMHCRFADLGKMVHYPMVLIVNFATEGGVVVDRQIIRLRPGYALLISPNKFHDYTVTGDDSEALWLFINFQGQQDRYLAALGDHPVPVSDSCLIFIEALVRMYASGGGKRRVEPFMNQVSLLVALILENLMAESQVEGGAYAETLYRKGAVQPYHILQRASEFIFQNLDAPLRIQEVAAELGISAGYLRNIFHAKLGMGLGEYIRYVRLQHAIVLMDTTDKSLSEIAMESGYGSLSAFSRAFSKNKGMPPGDFRLRYNLRTAKAVPLPPPPG